LARKDSGTSGKAPPESSWSIHRWRFALAIAVGVIVATGWSLLLSWAAGLPRISPVSLAAAAERGNTPSTWLFTCAVFSFAALFVQSLIHLLIRLCRRSQQRAVR
jgi:polyferredoxin